MIYRNVLELIGNTPIVKLEKLSKKYNNNLYAKLEKQNPAGSSKDRIAYYIIRNLIEDKTINNDTTIIEATSGNTGIGLAMVCAYYGLKLIIVMCESVTVERVKLIEAYGATVVLTKKEAGIEGAILKAKEINQEIKNSYYIDQFNNLNNVLSHYETTAEEILSEEQINFDVIIVGMGSSGTIMGIAKKMKKYTNTKMVGVEPYNCPYYTKEKTGNYMIPGIGTTFMPNITSKELLDQIVLVGDDEAKTCMYEIMKNEGVSVGLSSGAVFCGITRYIKEYNLVDKNILLIFPDSITKYLSIL